MLGNISLSSAATEFSNQWLTFKRSTFPTSIAERLELPFPYLQQSNGFLLKRIIYNHAKNIEQGNHHSSLTRGKNRKKRHEFFKKTKQSQQRQWSSILLKQKCKCILMSFFRGYGRNVISPYEGQECKRKSMAIKKKKLSNVFQVLFEHLVL